MPSRQRKRDYFSSILRKKPKSDAASIVAAEGSALTTSDLDGLLLHEKQNHSTQTQPATPDKGVQQAYSSTDKLPNHSPNSSNSRISVTALPDTTGTRDVGVSDVPPDLWRRAYEDLRTRERALVEDFQRSITDIANEEAGAEHENLDYNAIQTIVRQKINDREAEYLIVQLGKQPIKIREVGEKIVKAILWSSTFVGAAVSTQPYAALAWSGISIVLPLLLNNSKQNVAMVEGLDSITNLMQLFRIREEIYLQDGEVPHKPEFEAAVVDLYSAVFEYEARVITHLSNGTVKRGISSTFALNGWDSMMTRIQAADQRCAAFANLFDKSRETDLLASSEASKQIHGKILTSFQSFQEELQKHRQDDQEMQLLQSLSSDYKGDKELISRRVDGTCEWFLNDQNFMKWRDSDTSSLLWLSSGPGCGKSVLSKALIDERLVTNSILCSTVCYFFFKDGHEQRTHAADALSAILHQLLQNPKLTSYGFASQKIHGEHLCKRFIDLWEILVKCAQDSEAGEIVCVIDALDECEKESRAQLIREIIHLFSPEGTHRRASSNLKFLVTSRPYKDIEDRIERLSETSSYIHFDVDDKSNELGRDINLVIDIQVKTFAWNFSSGEQQRIADELKSKENRTYLWLFLTIDIIKGSRTKYSKPSSVRSILSELPNEVSDAYEKILSKSEDPEVAKQLLHIIVAATRPLTLQEANIALAIAMHYQRGIAHKDLDLWPTKDFSSIVKNLCGLMVAIHDDKLVLLHQTVREFLIAKSPANSSIVPQRTSVNNASTAMEWRGCLDISNAHGLMCQICLNYLTLPDFSKCFQDICPTDKDETSYGETAERSSDPDTRLPKGRSAHSSTGTELLDSSTSSYQDHYLESKPLKKFVKEALENYAFLDYSALNWAHHYRLQRQQYRASLHPDAELLCDPDRNHFVYWASVTTFRSTDDFLSGCDRLGVASYLGLVDVVKKSLHQVKDIDAKQRIYVYCSGIGKKVLTFTDKKTALMIAIDQGYVDVVRILVEKGANCSLRDVYGNSPLSGALKETSVVCLADRLAIIDLLLSGGVDINSKVIHNQTALHYACSSDQMELVKFLLKHGADLEAPTGESNWTVLQEIIMRGFEHMVAILLDHGADFRAHTNGKYKTNSKYKKTLPAGGSALHIAAYMAHTEMVDTLVKRGADINDYTETHGTPLIAACSQPFRFGVLRTVRILIENGANIHTVVPSSGNALQAASFNGHADIVTLLLLNKADVNNRGGKYDIALIAACCGIKKKEALETVKVLIENDADTNAVGENGSTALYEAALRGHPDTVKLLIESGANTNAHTRPTKAPLVATCFGKGNRTYTANILLDNGADINASESYAVKMGSMFGNKDYVNFLVGRGASLAPSGSGFTALHAAVLHGRANIADALIAHGVGVNSHHSDLGTPLHVACSKEADVQILAGLPRPIRDLNRSSLNVVEGQPELALLHVKLSILRLNLVKLLVKKGADVNALRRRGTSVLHDALKRNDPELVDFLIGKGAIDQAGEDTDAEEGAEAALLPFKLPF